MTLIGAAVWVCVHVERESEREKERERERERESARERERMLTYSNIFIRDSRANNLHASPQSLIDLP